MGITLSAYDPDEGDVEEKEGHFLYGHYPVGMSSGHLEVNQLHFELDPLPPTDPKLLHIRSSSLDTGLRLHSHSNDHHDIHRGPMLSLLNSIDEVVSTDDESFDDIEVYLNQSDTA